MDTEPDAVFKSSYAVMLASMDRETGRADIFGLVAIHLHDHATLGQDAQVIVCVRVRNRIVTRRKVHLLGVHTRREVMHDPQINLNTHACRF